MNYPKPVVIFEKGALLVKTTNLDKKIFEWFGHNFADWYSAVLEDAVANLAREAA